MNRNRILSVLSLVLPLSVTPSLCSAIFTNVTETFDAPPLTAGIEEAPHFFENGFLSGENGWVLVEGGSANFGQRTATGPGGVTSDVANVRSYEGATPAFMVRQLWATGESLTEGVVTFDLTDILPGHSETSLRLILLGDNGAATALSLDVGDVDTNTVNRFEVQTTGGGTVIADSNTVTTTGAPLAWHNPGAYATLIVAFNTDTDQAFVRIATTDSGGTTRSTTPMTVAMTDVPGGAIDQVTLQLNAPTRTSGGATAGSLAWMDTFSIIERPVPLTFHTFIEPFDAPPLTEGIEDPPHFFDNGFLDGENGWAVAEAGGANFGQRSDTVGPGNAFTNVANLRSYAGAAAAASATRQLWTNLTMLTEATVIFDITDVLPGFSETGLRLLLQGSNGLATALSLDLGDVDTNTVNKFEALVTGTSNVIADASTVTTNGLALEWHDLSGAGDYVTVEVAFDTVADEATVTLTTTDSAGTDNSTAPVVVGMADVGPIDQVTLQLLPPRNGGGAAGSLAWMDTFSILGPLGPTIDPDFTGILVESNGAITVEWQSEAGRDYEVRKNVAINDATFNVIATVPGAAATTTHTDTNTVDNQSNYRVNLAP